MAPDAPGTGIPQHTLNDGTTLPAIGFGTYPLTRRGRRSPRSPVALEVGYRLLDTAVNYENEARGRRGDPPLRRPPRRDAGDQQDPRPPPRVRRRGRAASTSRWSGSASTTSTCTSSTGRTPRRDRYAEAWRALVDLQREGLVRSIGVSNFTEAHLHADHRRDRRDAGGQPDRAAPLLPAGARCAPSHERLGIRTESWSPLGKRQAPFAEPPVAARPRSATASRPAR